MGVSNFANNSHSAFTGFLNQSLLYHNILHHQVWRQWNSATGARQCMFIERPKPYGPPYTGPPPTEEIQDDDSVSGSCGETWWYGRQCFTYQAPWPWIDIIYQEFQWKNFIWDGGSGRVTEVGRLSANAKNAFNSFVGRLFAIRDKKRCFCIYYPICNKKLIFAHICKCMGPLLISHKQYIKSASTPSSITTTTIFTLCYCNLP